MALVEVLSDSTPSADVRTTSSSQSIAEASPTTFRFGHPTWNVPPLPPHFGFGPVPFAIPAFAPIPSPITRLWRHSPRSLRRLQRRACPEVQELFEAVRQAWQDQPWDLSMRQTMLAGSLPFIPPLTAYRDSGYVAYLAPGSTSAIRQEWVWENGPVGR